MANEKTEHLELNSKEILVREKNKKTSSKNREVYKLKGTNVFVKYIGSSVPKRKRGK